MVGHEIWREQLKNVQNEKHYKTEKHKHCLTWNMAIHTQNQKIIFKNDVKDHQSLTNTPVRKVFMSSMGIL